MKVTFTSRPCLKQEAGSSLALLQINYVEFHSSEESLPEPQRPPSHDLGKGALSAHRSLAKVRGCLAKQNQAEVLSHLPQFLCVQNVALPLVEALNGDI